MAKLEDINWAAIQVTFVRNTEFEKTKKDIDDNPEIKAEEDDPFRLEDYLNLVLLELQAESRIIDKIIPCIIGVDPDVIFIIHHKGITNDEHEE